MDNKFRFIGSEETIRDICYDQVCIQGYVSSGTICEINIAEGEEITAVSLEDDFEFKTCWAELEPYEHALANNSVSN